VTITGTGFAPGTKVRFDPALSTQVARVNDTTLEAVVPARSASGVVDVGVTVPGKPEVVKTGEYTYMTPKGTITKVDPPSGSVAGGTPVTLTGEKFSNRVSVMFRDKPATVLKADATTIVVATPGQEHVGAVDVRVDAGSELVGIASAGFTYTS
jgi:hypothetical protein